MSKTTKLTGHPWHIEKLTLQEGFPRRHRSRCIYYNPTTKKCFYRVDKCPGSNKCDNYK